MEIAALTDVGKLEQPPGNLCRVSPLTDGHCFRHGKRLRTLIVSERLPGTTLEEFLERHGKELTPAQLLGIAADTARTVAYYAEHGILHGDPHDENWMTDGSCNQSGRIQIGLLDFGNAYLTERHERLLRCEQVRERSGQEYFDDPADIKPPEWLATTDSSSVTDAIKANHDQYSEYVLQSL
jgi:serine/threonine protein kinase